MVTLRTLIKHRERQKELLREAEIALVRAALAESPGDAESVHGRLSMRGCTLDRAEIGRILRAARRAGEIQRDSRGVYALKPIDARRTRRRSSAA